MTHNSLNSTHLPQSVPQTASNGNGNPLHDIAEAVRSSGESADTLGLPLTRSTISNGNSISTSGSNGHPVTSSEDVLAEELTIAGGPMHAARVDVQEEVIIRRGKSLQGLAVVGQADGVRLGQVGDLIFNPENDRLIALVLVNKDLFGLLDAQIVPWNEVHKLGQDIVLVRGAASNIKWSDYAPLEAGSYHRASLLSGTQIVTTDGRNLGTLADICIDELSGQVVGYDVSTGFIADSLQGKKFLPVPPNLTLGQDAAIAPADAAALLK